MRFIDEDDFEEVDPRIVHADDVPAVELRERDDVVPKLRMRPVDEVLGLEEMAAKLWYFEPGDEIGFHAHPEEEELYYVIAGEFSVKTGDPDDPQYTVVGEGTFFAAGPNEPHGHRCIGDGKGVVLALGAPADAGDDVLDPHE